MRAASSVLLLGLALLAASLLTASAVTVAIAFTGYVHGGITSVSSGQFCNVNNLDDSLPSSSCTGGCDRRQQFFADRRVDHPGLITVDLGIYFWGSVYYTLYGAAPGVDCFVAAGYDVAALGGGDFYAGYANFSQFIREVDDQSPVQFISTNVEFSNTPGNHFYGRVARSWSKDLGGGVKVGFISPMAPMYTATVNAPASEMVISANGTSSTANYLRQEIYNLRQAGANVIVMLIEFTREYPNDLVLAKELEHIDIVLGCRDPNPPATATVVENIYGDSFLFASVGDGYGVDVGTIVAEFNADGTFADINAAAAASVRTRITATMPRNTTTQAAIAADYDLTTGSFMQPIASATAYIDCREGTLFQPGDNGCRTGSCPMGRLLVDAMASYCQPSADAPICVQVLNSGSIRRCMDPLPAGQFVDIRPFDTYNIVPFFNSLVQIQVPGSVLLKALAHSISSLPSEHARYLQHNMRVVFNPYPRTDIPAADFESRILSAEVRASETAEWEPLNLTAYYTVVMASYLATGGDDYSMFVSDAWEIQELGMTFSDAIINYLSAKTAPITYPTYEAETACLTAETPVPQSSNCLTTYVNQTYNEYNRCPSNAGFCAAHANSLYYGSIWVDGSDCADCSGVGVCAERVCTCSGSYTQSITDPDGVLISETTWAYVNGVPTTGPWAGVTMIRGADCGETREYKHLTTGLRAATYAAAGVAYVVALGWLFALLYYRSQPVVRASSPYFGMIMCLGGIVAATSLVLDASGDKTIDTCNASVWLLVIGYSLIFACLFVKTHRIHTIFNAKRLKGRAVYTDAWVLAYVGLITVINLVILVVYRAVSPLTPNLFALSGSFAIAERCSSDEIAFTAVLLVYNGLLLAWGIYLAVRTRNVDSNFNESKWIGIAVYNCAISAIVILIIAYVVAESEPVIATLIRAWIVAYIIVISLTVMFYPRIRLHLLGVRASTAARSEASDLEKQAVRDKRVIQALVQRMKEHDAHVAERNSVLVKLIDELTSNDIAAPEKVAAFNRTELAQQAVAAAAADAATAAGGAAAGAGGAASRRQSAMPHQPGASVAGATAAAGVPFDRPASSAGGSVAASPTSRTHVRRPMFANMGASMVNVASPPEAQRRVAPPPAGAGSVAASDVELQQL